MQVPWFTWKPAIWAFAQFCLSLSTVAGAYNKKSSLNFPMRFVMSFWQPITQKLYLKLNFIILTCFWSKDRSSAFARRHGNSPAKVRCGIPGLHERRWWAVQSVGDASDARQTEPTCTKFYKNPFCHKHSAWNLVRNILNISIYTYSILDILILNMQSKVECHHAHFDLQCWQAPGIRGFSSLPNCFSVRGSSIFSPLMPSLDSMRLGGGRHEKT